MNDRMKHIAANVKKYREYKGLTQADFDNWIGVSRGATFRVEKGRPAKLSYIFALEDATRISYQAWARELSDDEMLSLIARAGV
mgnify:CR=1 FL=1